MIKKFSIRQKKNQFKPDPNIDSYLKILDEEAHMEKLGLRLPNKKIKKNKKIKLLFEKDKGLIESIEKYKMNYATYQKIIKCTEYLDTFDQRIQNFSLKYIQYLQETGYIDSVKKSPYEFNHEDITAKGFLASQINECNLFILTEIIINKLLHNLSPCEIVSFLSVFVTDLKLKHDYTLDEIYGTDHVISQIKKVNDIISRYKQAEMKYGIISEDNFWNISYNFVDGSYSWALGDDLKTVFEYCDIFEGDFVKSMLKISNLVKDVKILSNIYGDLTIAPVLDEVNELILRGIVNINSLYVNA
jgi:superfamily II RNA helicase